jgi:translation initiation factor 3 subunit A
MQKKGSQQKPKVLYEYFENLAKMFWKSEFFLYSAISYFNHYVLLKGRLRTMSAEEITHKSNTFVLSVLCIPPLLNEDRQTEDAKLSAGSLLSSEVNLLSKQDLITYIKKHNILDLCSDQVKETYFLIEESKNVMSLTRNSEPLLRNIKEKYGAFFIPLQSIIVYKLLALLSQLYTKIKIENFSRFLGSLDFTFVENIIHEASGSDAIRVRVDHKRKLLVFKDDVKDMRNISLKLVNFSEDLKEVMHSIENTREQPQEGKILQGLKDEARRYADSARGAIERRAKLIKENRKLVEEAYAKHRPKEIRDNASEASQRGTLNVEELEREKKMDKIKAMMQLMQREKKLTLIKQLKEIKGFKIGTKRFDQFTEEEIEQFSLEKLDIAKEEWDRREKDKEEAAIKNAFRRVDHLERARREEYLNVLKKNWAEAKDDKEEIMTTHRENFVKMIAFKNNMKGAQAFREQYCTKLREEKAETFEEEMQEFREKIIEDFKGKILEAAKESLKTQQEAEEAERKKREEEIAKQRKRLEDERDSQATIQTFGGMQRNTATAAEMRKTEEVKGGDSTGFRRTDKPDDKKPTATTGFGGIQRRDITKEEPKPTPTGIISRNTEVKKEETKEGERPRFVNAAKKDPFGGAKAAEPIKREEPKKEEPKKEEPKKDEWRTVEKPAQTTAPTGGFSRNAATSGTTTSGGPPKFSRGAGAGTSTTENKPSGGGSGWRKN